ncbi:MAG: hypothetical protein KDC67_00525 [Ignavibacteriae bacterium]|nr:hypothetical protein [Ignavibacteriota bacterium]
MKKIVLISLFFGATNLFAQQQQDSILVKEIPTIKNNVFQQQQEINALTKKLNDQNYIIGKQSKTISVLQEQNSNLNGSIDSLSQLIQTNSQNIVTNSQELGTKIQETGQKADSKIAELDSNVEKNRLYWIIATLATLLLGGLIYWLLGKRITSSKTDVETQIRNTKASLEEESVKLDNKLVEVLETQLKLQQETSKSQPIASNGKADHSLALKVADEIVRMQKNISKMGNETKGLKPLLKGIERIQNNFAANGYEMINHLNKAYDERFNIDVINFITDENLEEGTRIITAVIKPQVNYKGVLIQRAQVDVSQN